MKTIEELESELDWAVDKIKELDAKILFLAEFVAGEELDYVEITPEDMMNSLAMLREKPDVLDS